MAILRYIKGVIRVTREILKATQREITNKGALNTLRNDGFVPGVLYGHHREALSVKLDTPSIEKFLKYHGVGTTLDIELDGKQTMVMLKDIQREVLKDSLLHVDFQELTAGEKVKVKLPIHFINRESIGGHTTVLQEIMHEIEVQTLPKDLVETIDVDVSGMTVGDSIKVIDLAISKDDKYEVLADLDSIVISLNHARAQVDEVEEPDTIRTEVPLVSETVATEE